MRYFYIFKINSNIANLLKDKPYELFSTLECIYYRDIDDVLLDDVFIKQIIEPLMIRDLDILLFKEYKNNYFYMKYKNVHSMHDIYRRENTTLFLYKTYLKLETDVIKPPFLEFLKSIPNLFVCDFLEKDYFWLDSLVKLEVLT